MDILKRIVDLRKERNWTEYQLAEQSGLTQSTISSWYRKNMLPTIPSFVMLLELHYRSFFWKMNAKLQH